MKKSTARKKAVPAPRRPLSGPGGDPAKLDGKPKGRSGKAFLVVGVGASAGGLEAFTRLLKALPTDTGLAFVLLQHLDPQHESALPELLRRTTTMPVREVTNHLAVEPNQVYVIPPNRQMEIKQGVLELEPRGKPARGERHLINAFLVSLARDQGQRAIGVILSGTAADGTLGLEAIKAEGGITFAQDKSAKFDSMPRSAVSAGFVDFVLSPEKIAQELTRIARHPLLARAPADSSGPQPERPPEADAPTGPESHRASGEDSFKKILLLLHRHSGVNFSLYKTNTIRRRIVRRMVLNHKKSPDAYVRFLRDNAKELEALYSDVLISVTSFFRNPEAFDVLKRKIFPALLQKQRKSGAPIRIWTLGCSTGQEAYSIVMAYAEFAERRLHAPPLQVFATDLNEALLVKARHGLYAKSLAQDISAERLRRFFVETQGGYRVSKTVREQVVFARQNVLTDPPFSRMDLVSCRNLLIYFEAELQKKIIPVFHYALNPGGFLFLGTSETVGQFTDLFGPADKRQRIYSRKAAPLSPLRLAPSDGRRPSTPDRSRTLSTAERRQILPARGEPSAQREADRISVSLFSPPGVLIDAELNVLQFRGATGAYLEPPSGKASFNVVKMAREGLTHPLREALSLAKRDLKPVLHKAVRARSGNATKLVDLQVIPLKNLQERCYLVFFLDEVAPAALPGPTLPPAEITRPSEKNALVRRVRELESELSGNRDFTRSIQEQFDSSTEELQVSTEEAQSANEELQSINEELETSKEEIESSNEELITVNEEMLRRNEELKQLNSDLNNLHVSIDTAILVVGRDLTIRRFTVQAEKIFNLLPGDIGRSLSGVRHNLDFEGLDEFIRKVIDTVRFRQVEVRDRAGHWYSLRVRPYISDENKIDGAVLVLVDIDALKDTERGLRLSEARYQTLFNLGPVAVCTCDASGRIREFNLRAAELWGRRPEIGASGESFCGSFRMHTLGGNFIPHEEGPMAQVLKGRYVGKFEGEVQIERPDGSMITVQAHIAPLRDDQGAITGAINSFIDVTERNRTDAALRENVARLRFMAESMPQKIFTATATGEVDYVNRQWLEFTGMTFEQLRGSGWKQAIHPGELEENLRRWKQAIQSGEDIQLDRRIRGKDGVYRWHLNRARAMRDATGQVQMWIGSDTDVDDARRAMEEMARSDQAKDEFLAVLSHELRTPLTPVLLMAAELRNNPGLPAEVRKQLGVIERNVTLEARLIDDLLDVTKIAHGKMLFRMEECDAHVLIDSAIEIAHEEATAKGISIRREFSARSSRMMADPTRFQQLIWNLVRNAIKFSPPGGQIAVSSSEIALAGGKRGLRIEVADAGIGIAPEDLERIFAPFDQAGRSGDQRFGGMGLGLTIARAVVGLHGGSITAHSAGLDRGATFVVELPGLIDSAAPFSLDPVQAPSPAALPPGSARRYSLLLVEDHVSTLEALASILRRDGHRVVTATTVGAAAAAAGATQIDLVISDVGLPDGSGIELMEELRGSYGLRGIALSGYGTEEDIARSLAAGFVAHLVKPVSAAELRRAIAAVVPPRPGEASG